MAVKEEFARSIPLLGEEGLERLARARVIVFGLGGGGSYVCEALARGGVGSLELVDGDAVDVTNINRQLFALHSTVGRPKTEAAASRLADINPEIQIRSRQCFYTPQTAADFDFAAYDYVVDAVDDVAAKLSIIENAFRAGAPVISSMGAGNKLDPAAFRVAKIEETRVCPLARVMRRELKKRGISGVKAVYSQEEPACSGRVPASVSFVPSACGLLIAKTVIEDLIAAE